MATGWELELLVTRLVEGGGLGWDGFLGMRGRINRWGYG